MAQVHFTHRLDVNAVRAIIASPNGGVAKDMLRRGLLVETQAKRNLGGTGGWIPAAYAPRSIPSL